jgi:hypothetical protein
MVQSTTEVAMPTAPTSDPAFDPERKPDPAHRPGQPGAEDQPVRPGEAEVDEGMAPPGTFDERQTPVADIVEGAPQSENDSSAPLPAGEELPDLTTDGTTQDDARRYAGSHVDHSHEHWEDESGEPSSGHTD